VIFSELRFLFFFAAVFGVYWSLPRNRPRKYWLLATSYAFYAAWDWRFLSLIWISTLIDYWVGLKLEEHTDPIRRRRWVTVSVVANLGILGFFKYFNFFGESLFGMLDFLGLPVTFQALNIILPVGISFYTFQTMSYSLDIYRGKLRATHDPLDLALFVGFFPQLVAGPIVRARAFMPQMLEMHRLAAVEFRPALMLFLAGYVKKACVSDNISPFVDVYYANPSDFTVLSAWIATLLYAVQIYCDFSGYSDMAIACARMLGYELGENFDFPYLSPNITEFWGRWHISLSSWLRDYVYFSLGGSRGSNLFVHRNLFLTSLVTGLWHGAAWHYVVWGAMNGIAVSVHREWARWADGRVPLSALRTGLGIVATFYLICLEFVIFRAQNVADAIDVARSFVLFQTQGTRTLNPWLLVLFVVLAATHITTRYARQASWWRTAPDWAFAVGYGALAALALSFIHPTAQPFIYFQF
jgi:alginate O-acetyltransferase complex protein AlgI